jgi:hypothetical protein
MVVCAGIVMRLSRRVFVLVGVLELIVAVGVGVHRRHQARVPPIGCGVCPALRAVGVACACAVRYLHYCEDIGPISRGAA